MNSKGESKISGLGGASGIPKKKSFLVAPKSYSKPRFKAGDRVKISGVKTGIVRFIGQTHFAEGNWCGVELDDPDGKHDGLVGDTRYFQCLPSHGIFAPVQKVEMFTEDLYMYDSPTHLSEGSSGDERVLSPINEGSFTGEQSTPPENTSHLPEPKSHNRTRSLDSDIPRSSETKFQSKLARPKAVSRSISSHETDDADSLTDSTSSSRESSVGRVTGKATGARPKQSRLSPPGRGIPRKAEKRSAKDATRDSISEGDPAGMRPESHMQGKKTKISHQKQQLETTYVHETTEEEEEEEEEDDIPTIENPSRIDAKTALTLVYNVESSGSDSEKQVNTTFDMKTQRKMNSTFAKAESQYLNSTYTKDQNCDRSEISDASTNGRTFIKSPHQPRNVTFGKTVKEEDKLNKTVCTQERNFNATFSKKGSEEAETGQLSEPTSGAASSLHSPIPDLLSSAGFVRQASLEWEPDPQAMAISTSSLGILTETQLAEMMGRSFLGDDLANKEQEIFIAKEQELLDKEIAGIATPEIDMFTLSGSESSPELIMCKKTIANNRTFDSLNIQTSTPLSPPPPTLKSAGEKLASPMTDGCTKPGITSKLYKQELTDDNQTFCAEYNTEGAVDYETDISKADEDGIPKSVNIQSDTFSKEVKPQTNLEDLKCHRLSASFELTKTAVEQYASLVKGAEEEKTHTKVGMLKTTDLMAASLEGRLARLITDNEQGLLEEPFPPDLMTSFSKSISVERDTDGDLDDTSLLYPFNSVDSFWDSMSQAKAPKLPNNDSDTNVKPDVMLSSLEEYQNMERSCLNKTGDISPRESSQYQGSQQASGSTIVAPADSQTTLGSTFVAHPDSQTALGSTFVADPESRKIFSVGDTSADQDTTMLSDPDEQTSATPNLCLMQDIVVCPKHPPEVTIGNTTLCLDTTHNLRPDNALSERCISLDSLDGQDNGSEQLSPTSGGDVNRHLTSSGKQLLADLEAGHARTERPISLVSTCSADTGIMADYKSEGDHAERPVSIVSTSSVDTGYQPDPEVDLVSLTRSSSTQECDTLTQLTPRSEADPQDLDPATQEPSLDTTQPANTTVVRGDGQSTSKGGMSRVTPDEDDGGGTVDKQRLMAEGSTETPEVDCVESDMHHVPVVSPDESDPEETSGTESQQGDESTVPEAITPETDTVALEPAISSCPPRATPATYAQKTGAEESMDTEHHDVAMSCSGSHGDEAMDTEMVESATMRDVMEKCQNSEPEQLVAELCVQAHFMEREMDMEVCQDGREVDMLPDVCEKAERDSEGSVKPLMDISDETCDTNKSAESADLHGVEKLQESPVQVARDILLENGEEASLHTSNSGPDEIVIKSGQKKSDKNTKVAKDAPKAGRVQRKRKDMESPGLPNSKNPRPPQTPESKSESKKSSPKLVTKSSSASQRRPQSTSPQFDKTMDVKKSPSKNLKEVSNKKKSDVSSSSSASPQSSHKGTPEKKTFAKKTDPSKEKEKQILKARKELDLLQSVSSISIAPHLTTIEACPVILSSDHDSVGGSEDAASQRSTSSARRSLPKSKWTKPGDKASAQDKPDTESAVGKIPQPKAMGTPKVGIPKPSARPGGLPRPSNGLSAKRTLPSANTTKVSSTATEPKVAKTALKSRLPPRKSTSTARGSESTTPGTAVDKMQNRPSSAPGIRKPGTSSVSSQQRAADRSMSMGSDTQLSDISQVSSQGHKSQTEHPSGSSSTPDTLRKPSLGPRRSLVEPSIKKPESGRRATLALPSASKGLAPIATSTPAPKRATNQNKNKPARNGTAAAPTSGTIRRPHQPDLVANTISSSHASQEVERLEALCEARTKELNRIKVQLRKRSSGFEAMTVLIKYLTEELNAFSCPQVTAQLADAQEHLQKAAAHLEELTTQRDALIAEIQCIKQQHIEDNQLVVSSHQVALQALEERLTTERDDKIRQLIEKHSRDLSALKAFHERNIREFETERDNLLAEKEAEYTEELTRRKQEYDQASAELQQEQGSKLNEITLRFESIKVNLLEKVDFLRQEGEDLRLREASMVEKCKRDSEYKIEHGLAQYRQEVDSLRAVMELRNAEIHELRRRNVENEKRMEEIPRSREEIRSLKQKIENLEAIIDIRADNEKQLSEKHQVLLRKYDRDSKAMKRVSMDNEELVWRLSMSDMSSPDSFRRSVSHSPTNSECSTPEPSRRRKSPMPHSPINPPTSSPIQKTPPVTNLKRSGTYELLNQDLDEESNVRSDS